MPRKDLNRLHILQKVLDQELKQIDAARILKITDRQVRNLIDRLRTEGPSGIVSKLTGREGNHRAPAHLKQRVLALLREKYEGFGPKFAENKNQKTSSKTQTALFWRTNSGGSVTRSMVWTLYNMLM